MLSVCMRVCVLMCVCVCVCVCLCVSERETVHLLPSFCPNSLMVSEALSAAPPMAVCVCRETSSAAMGGHMTKGESSGCGPGSSVGDRKS